MLTEGRIGTEDIRMALDQVVSQTADTLTVAGGPRSIRLVPQVPAWLRAQCYRRLPVHPRRHAGEPDADEVLEKGLMIRLAVPVLDQET
jgi:hypothetical protein